MLITSAGDALKTSFGVTCKIMWERPQYVKWDVLKMLVKDVLRMLEGDVPWHYLEGHMGTSIERLSETSTESFP